MKTYKNKIGVTLTEMLVVVAVIVVLASLVITAATRIRNQSNEQLAENTFATLTAAMQQFRDFGYRYNNSDYSDFDFPLDCNGFSQDDIKTTLEAAFGLLPPATVSITDLAGSTAFNHKLEYSGCEVLYFFLGKVPQSRKTLDKIDRSLVTDEDDNGNRMKVTIDGRPYPLLRVIDPWGTTLHYDYYYEEGSVIAEMRKTKRTFPVITSAGPDKMFGTSDDISSRN